MKDQNAAPRATISAVNVAERPAGQGVGGAGRPGRREEGPDELPPPMAPHALLALLLGAAAGALGAAVVLPTWLPGLSTSLLGPEPAAYWHLARSSAMVAYALLWLAMVFGLLMSNRLARAWPGGPVAFDLHQHTSLLGLAFALFHALILLGDRFIAATPAQILTPFAYAEYRPLWVGLGQLALYGLALVGLSFYLRGRLGRRAWRLVHVLSYGVFLLALAHGVMSGSDGGVFVVRALYWASAGSVLFLSVYRVLALRRRAE